MSSSPKHPGVVRKIAQSFDEMERTKTEQERQEAEDRRRSEEERNLETIVPGLSQRIPPKVPPRPQGPSRQRKHQPTQPPPLLSAQEQSPPSSPHEGDFEAAVHSLTSPVFEPDTVRPTTPESLVEPYVMSPKQETPSRETSPRQQSADDARVQKLESKITRVEQEVEKLKQERHEVDEEVKTLRDQLKEAQKRYHDANVSTDHLNQIKNLTTALKLSEQRQDDLEERLDEKRRKERELRDELDEARAKLRCRRVSSRDGARSGRHEYGYGRRIEKTEYTLVKTRRAREAGRGRAEKSDVGCLCM